MITNSSWPWLFANLQIEYDAEQHLVRRNHGLIKEARKKEYPLCDSHYLSLLNTSKKGFNDLAIRIT